MKTFWKKFISPKNIISKPIQKFSETSKQITKFKSLESLWSSETYLKNMGTQVDYQADILINKGACADVYEALNLPKNQKVVIKAITTSTLMNRFFPKKELILLTLLKHENIIELNDYFIEEDSGLLCLVLKYFPNEHSLSCDSLEVISPADLKIYMKQLLSAIEYCHSENVYHLDIKPHNILIDIKNKKTKLIDFGSADFYFPEKENRLKVYSRFMKPPEILLGNKRYTLTADVWATGAIFAGLIFNRDPFFKGSNLINQIMSITQIFGKETLLNYIIKYNLTVDQSILDIIKRKPSKPYNLRDFVSNNNKKYFSDEACDLIEKMLTIDHNERISAKAALEHPYFQ